MLRAGLVSLFFPVFVCAQSSWIDSLYLDEEIPLTVVDEFPCEDVWQPEQQDVEAQIDCATSICLETHFINLDPNSYITLDSLEKALISLDVQERSFSFDTTNCSLEDIQYPISSDTLEKETTYQKDVDPTRQETQFIEIQQITSAIQEVVQETESITSVIDVPEDPVYYEMTVSFMVQDPTDRFSEKVCVDAELFQNILLGPIDEIILGFEEIILPHARPQKEHFCTYSTNPWEGSVYADEVCIPQELVLACFMTVDFSMQDSCGIQQIYTRTSDGSSLLIEHIAFHLRCSKAPPLQKYALAKGYKSPAPHHNPLLLNFSIPTSLHAFYVDHKEQQDVFSASMHPKHTLLKEVLIAQMHHQNCCGHTTTLLDGFIQSLPREAKFFAKKDWIVCIDTHKNKPHKGHLLPEKSAHLLYAKAFLPHLGDSKILSSEPTSFAWQEDPVFSCAQKPSPLVYDFTYHNSEIPLCQLLTKEDWGNISPRALAMYTKIDRYAKTEYHALFTKDIEHLLQERDSQQIDLEDISSTIPRIFSAGMHALVLLKAQGIPPHLYLDLQEQAKDVNRLHRFTYYNLIHMPSLEDLQTASVGDDFRTDVKIRRSIHGDGYIFCVKVSPVEKNLFYPVPHKIYFALDDSSSIESHRFDTYKKAILESIPYLDREVLFNVFNWNESFDPLSHQDLRPSHTALQIIKKKLRKTYQGKRSSLRSFQEFLEKISTEAADSESIYSVVLLSDGHFMKNIRLNKEALRQIYKNIPDNMSLYTATVSDKNNLEMLDLLARLGKGELLHNQTHASFPRKVSSLTRSLKQPLASNVEITNVSSSTKTYIFKNNMPPFFEGRPYVVYGTCAKPEEFTLFLQGYTENAWYNIKKKISLQDALRAKKGLERDFAKKQAFIEKMLFLEDADEKHLENASQILYPFVH